MRARLLFYLREFNDYILFVRSETYHAEKLALARRRHKPL